MRIREALHRIREALDNWYRKARSDTTSALVLTLMLLALTRGAVFASLLPFPASSTESSTVAYSWTLAHTLKLPSGQTQLPQPLRELRSGGPTSQTEGESVQQAPPAPGAQGETGTQSQPSVFHLVVAVLLFFTQFLAPALQIFLMRLLSVLLSALVVWFAFDITRTVAPGNRAAQLAVPLIITLHPQFSLIAASATPTMLYVFGFTALIVLAIRLLAPGANLQQTVILIGAALILAVPADGAILTGLALLVFGLSYFGVLRDQPVWKAVVHAAPWVAGSVFIWRSVLPDAIPKVLPWLTAGPSLPSFRAEISPSYVTAAVVLKGLVGLPSDPSGWQMYPLVPWLLSGGITVALLALGGLALSFIRFVRRRLGERKDILLPSVPAGMRPGAAVFLTALALTYFTQLPVTLGLLGDAGAAQGTLGSAGDLALPYIQSVALLGLLFLVARYVADNAEAIKRLLAPRDRSRAYILWAMALMTVYAIIIGPPAGHASPEFSAVAIVPATYFLVVGWQALWRQFATTPKLIVDAFWTLLAVTLLAVISALLPDLGSVLGLTPLSSLMPTWFVIAFVVALLWNARRFIAEINKLRVPNSQGVSPESEPTPSATRSDTDISLTWQSPPSRRPTE